MILPGTYMPVNGLTHRHATAEPGTIKHEHAGGDVPHDHNYRKWWPIPWIGRLWLAGVALLVTGLVLSQPDVEGVGTGLLLATFYLGLVSGR